MINKKIILLAIFLVCLFAISAVSAADNVTGDVVSVENDNQIIESIDNEILNTNPKTFTDLDNAINNNTDCDIYLDSDYKFNSNSDSNFVSGITINREVTIQGNGKTIDGMNIAKIFQLTKSNVIIKDIKFICSISAIDCWNSNITLINCNFEDNIVEYGNTISCDSNAILTNCTFTNSSTCLITHGSITDCTFDNITFGWVEVQ